MDKDMLTRGKTLRTRSMVAMGSPLNGYTDSGDRGKEQNDKIKEFVLLGEPQLFDKFGMVETKGKMNPLLRSPYLSDPETEQKMDVDWFSMPTNQNEFSRMLGGDFLMVIFSILFVSVRTAVCTPRACAPSSRS